MNIGILGTGSIARTMAAEFAKFPAFRCEAPCFPGRCRRCSTRPAATPHWKRPGRWSPFWKPPGRMHSWASELSTVNDKLFGVFCSCQISQDYL